MKRNIHLRYFNPGGSAFLRSANRRYAINVSSNGAHLGHRQSALRCIRKDDHVPLLTRQHGRTIFTETIPTVLLPPAAFLGFFITLWVYKCCMMVLFQNKIIYMPGLPPGARQEKIQDYAKQCGSIRWEEKHIRSLDGTDIALCIGTSRSESLPGTKHIVVLYFQG